MFLIVLLLFGTTKASYLPIPDSLSLGVGGSAYQTEGAWNEEGRGPSVWDTMVHSHPDLIANHSNGDISSDSYHLWKEDIILAADLSSRHYRFSISWSRLMPYGTPEYINPWAVDHYYSMISQSKSYRMQPIVTMYHWDLPQALEDIGGWLNPDIVDHFVNYARVIYELFAYTATYWITINDPLNYCVTTYDLDEGAPTVEKSPGIGCYLCVKHMLLAHAKAYRLNKKDFIYRNNGVGITVDAIWAEPKSNISAEDIEAANREMQMTLHWLTNPLLSSDGDYPELMKSRIDTLSMVEGFAESRLPHFTDEEIAIVRHATDFLSLTHFHSYLISSASIPDSDPPSFDKDKGTIRETDPDWWPIGYPEGLRKLLNYISDTYRNPQIYITTGYKDQDSGIEDENRSTFFKKFVNQVVMALSEDGCEIEVFTAWSLLDQMEWREGYKSQFGLYHVNFDDPNKTRTKKKSGRDYEFILATRISDDT